VNDALAAWDLPVDRAVTLDDGLINHTWRLDRNGTPVAALQRLNTRIFSPLVHEDIEAVTARLAERGVVTPRLVRTRAGELWHSGADGSVWRILTWEGDTTLHAVDSPERAYAAAALVARFHASVADLTHTFKSVRPGVHDTEAHMSGLRQALAACPDHRLYAQVAPLAERVLARWETLRAELPALPLQVIHGDLKISNIRFRGQEAWCLVDLDTLQHNTLDVELGDAMRSWCNPSREDDAHARFDVKIFSAAMAGYQSAVSLSDAARSAVVPGVLRITWELTARFCRDALLESYFGWDRTRFPAAGEHNLARARGQAALATDLERRRDEAEAALRR
jgi:Ser/Thr protein kinase RdoA (MazF antagonist)